MRLDKLLEELGWAGNTELRNVLEVEWECSQKDLPTNALPFLLPESVADACQVLSLPTGAKESLFTVAGKVLSDPQLRTLAWHFHHCAFRSATYPWWGPIAQWPSADSLTGLLKSDGRTFYLLILVSGLPGMQTIYDARGIPRDVFRDTIGALRDELVDLNERENMWGLSGSDLVQWYRFALRGELFRLGRLEFQFGLFRWPVRVFRHRISHAVLALSEGGVSFLPSGQASGPGRVDTTGEWMSELTIKDDGVIGHPILPTGRVLRRVVDLPYTAWQQVLARNDPALYIHIPEDRPLAHDLCRKSFEQSTEFFRRHFPERPYTCFCCDSWVLNSELQEVLPPTSNMVRFQREMYLLPSVTQDPQLTDVIFGGMPQDPRQSPRDTNLQRALLDYIASGRRFHASAGAGFLLLDDLEWGQQVYIRQELPSFAE